MGPFTMGPIPEVRMPCGPLAGPDGEGPGVRTHKQDWKPLGISDPPSVACAPGGSKGEGLRWFPSHPFPTPKHTPPSSPAPEGPASAPIALPSLQLSLEQGPEVSKPHSGHLGRSAWQLFYHCGMLHI